MQQLRFTAVHEDGQHLVLSTSDGTEMLVAVDERLRAALRPRPAPVDAPATDLRPRHVQAMIRAGQSPAEVAEITGWPADRVARFEGPILAEREHIAGMARAAHVRGRGADGMIPTLEARVRERLTARGVDADNTGWDATRPEGGTWTVLVTFVAGQRQRAAAWHFDPADKTVEALDDEARWLSEDEQALPGSAAGKELFGGAGAAEEVDLMTTMRERSRSRGRRKKSPTASTDPAGLPSLAEAPEQVLPLEDLAYDPDSMGLPPAARGESEEPAGKKPEERAGPRPARKAASRRRGRAVPEKAPGAKDGSAGKDGSEDQGVAAVAAGQGEETDSTDGAAPYDIALDFDDDYEVDPSPQEATLADLFGHEVAYNSASAQSDEDSDEGLDDELNELTDDEPDDSPGDADPAHEDTAGKDTTDEESPDNVTAGDDSAGEVAAGEAEAGAAPVDVTDSADAARVDDTAGAVEAAKGSADEPSAAQGSGKPKRRKDGRPGVPSWDDIMFGAKDRGH